MNYPGDGSEKPVTENGRQWLGAWRFAWGLFSPLIGFATAVVVVSAVIFATMVAGDPVLDGVSRLLGYAAHWPIFLALPVFVAIGLAALCVYVLTIFACVMVGPWVGTSVWESMPQWMSPDLTEPVVNDGE